MIHKNRCFSVAPVDSAEELANTLTKFIWCGCNGFRLGDLLFLNDSFSGDGVQEYAVIYQGKEIESITFGWCTEQQALEIIQGLEKQVANNSFNIYSDLENKIESPQEHKRCHLCA